MRGSGRQAAAVPVIITAYYVLGLPLGAYLAFRRDLGVPPALFKTCPNASFLRQAAAPSYKCLPSRCVRCRCWACAWACWWAPHSTH